MTAQPVAVRSCCIGSFGTEFTWLPMRPARQPFISGVDSTSDTSSHKYEPVCP